jgi:hypothetical protein
MVRVFSSLILSAGFVLFPSLVLASYQPGQTLDPACPPSDGTCVVVPSTGQWTTSGSNIIYTAGKVGIGTSSLSAVLSVEGSAANKLSLNSNAAGQQSAINFTDQGTSKWAVGKQTSFRYGQRTAL